MKLKIFQPRTFSYTSFSFFWDSLIHLLKKHNYVEEIRTSVKDMEVNLQYKTSSEDFLISDCQCVIENMETGEFWILSAADTLHPNVLLEKDNNKLKRVLLSQYNEAFIKENVGFENIHKYKPWIYFPSTPINLDQFYYERKFLREFKKPMYFAGLLADRPIINYFSKDHLYIKEKRVSQVDYFKELIHYDLALSVSGVGNICYRDVEYMALGVPFIRFEYENTLDPRLIPDVHYVSVSDDSNYLKSITNEYNCLDRVGDKYAADLIVKKYEMVIDNKSFLTKISTNARNYYEKYLMYPNNIKHTISLLS